MPLPPELAAALRRMGLAAEGAEGAPLAGGVSSDIWRVELRTGAICVKRALPRLRVAAEWQAPPVRNQFEARWLCWANAVVPGSAPRLLGQDVESGALAMEYLPPAENPLWKERLRAGRADAGFAAQVGETLARIHAATAFHPDVEAEFPTDDIFYAIRIEPYLLATARAHPDRADALHELARATMRTRRALVHGDVSPKNILVGAHGPVFLDAECAWWGDPAFDLAFCLNHLLLKCLWVPRARALFLACFDRLAEAYARRVSWEPAAALEGRAARLLPGLLLARIDGKSPVEYLTDDERKAPARRLGRALLASPVERLAEVRTAWERELAR